MVKTKPFEVQAEQGILSTTMLIPRQFKKKFKFYRYRALMAIK